MKNTVGGKDGAVDIRKKQETAGVITVFFALLSGVFLALLFLLIESVRVQGGRTQCANIVDMGNMSVFGEYEKKMLEDYEIFGVDASCGSGDFNMERLNGKLQHYMRYNLSAPEYSIPSITFDPWNLQLMGSKVSGYALLTDDDCENFYQQAVAYMHETAVTQLAGKLADYYQRSKKMEEDQQVFEIEKNSAEKEIEELKEREEQKRDELESNRESEAVRNGETQAQPLPEEERTPSDEKKKNPLKALWKLQRKSILKAVCPDREISSGRVGPFSLYSKRLWHKKGSLKAARPYGGLAGHLLFREYLLGTFPNFLTKDGEKKEGELAYQIEYILCGKNTDKANLTGTAKKLLLLREGCNYACAAADAQLSGQAQALAFSLIGWTGIPELTAILKHAVLIGWSYGESMMDLRILFNGGRVPAVKTKETWSVSLEKLPQIAEILSQGSRGQEEGMNYRDHLRILLNLQFVTTQKRRGVDMMEMNIRSCPSLSNFQADYMVVSMNDDVTWKIHPVFSKVTSAFTGRKDAGSPDLTVKGGYEYLVGGK